MDPSKFAAASDKRGAQTAREKKEKSKKEEAVPLLGDRIKLDKLLLYKASLQKATSPLEQCIAHIGPIQDILQILENDGFEVLDYWSSFKQMKFFVERMKTNLNDPEKVGVVDPKGEPIIYLQVVINRFASQLFRIYTLPVASLNERLRRYNLLTYAVQVRTEARSAADKNDSYYDSDTTEKKDFLKTLSAQLTVPESSNVWQQFMNKNAEPGAVAWDNFFKSYENHIKETISPSDETILRKLITKCGAPFVTPYAFNEFLKAFGDGSCSKASYHNAIKQWKTKGFIPFFTEADAKKFLIHECEGSYVVSLSAMAGCYFNVYVMTTELVTWHVSCDPKDKGISACKSALSRASSEGDNGNETLICASMSALYSRCRATIPFTVIGMNESYLGNVTQEEVVTLLWDTCEGTYIVYYVDDSSFLRISYKSMGTVKHLYVDRSVDDMLQLKWINSSPENIGERKICFDRFTTLEALINKHNSFLRFNFDFDGVPDVSVVLPEKDANTMEFAGPEKLDKGVMLNFKNCLGVETAGGYPANTLGSEILCDRFQIKIIGDRIFFVLADGCSWGIKPRTAAFKASQGFLDYVTDQKNLDDAKSVLSYRELILRGFRHAHNAVIAGIPENELFTACGRTTLLAGVMVPLEGVYKGEWGLIFTSVGDCKLFLWNDEEGTIDITYGNRFNARDAGDSGGRVGPYVDGGQPDLRNLKTYFWSVTQEDIIFAVTDGVYDNLDPECLGLTPEQANIPDYNDWSLIPPEQLVKYKSFSFCVGLNTLLAQCKEKTPYSISHVLVQNALAITHKSRTWVELHPNEPEPKNYLEFPGKMDHVTAIAISPRFSLLQDKTQPMEKKKVTKKLSEDKKAKIGKDEKLQTLPPTRQYALELKRHAKKIVPRAPLWKFNKKTGKPTELNGSSSLSVCIYCPKEEENLVSLANVSGWAVSTLPSEKTNCSEFFSLDHTNLSTVFGLSSASTYCKFSVQAAELALIRFMASCCNYLNDKKDTGDIADALIDIFEETNNQISSTIKHADANIQGLQNTTMIGGVCVKHTDEHALKNGGKQWTTILINVGNNKAFYWDPVTLELTDLCPDNHLNDVGCLGPYSVSADDPNWSNINLYHFPCAENAIILVLSAGVLHNFDPIHLGVEVIRSDFAEEMEKQSRVAIHANLETLLKTATTNNMVFDYAKVIFDYVARTTRTRSEQQATTGFSPKKRSLDSQGYLSHATCLAFRVGMAGDKEPPPPVTSFDVAVNRKSRRGQSERNLNSNSIKHGQSAEKIERNAISSVTSPRMVTMKDNNKSDIHVVSQNNFYIGSGPDTTSARESRRNNSSGLTHSSPRSEFGLSTNSLKHKSGAHKERKGLGHRSKTASSGSSTDARDAANLKVASASNSSKENT